MLQFINIKLYVSASTIFFITAYKVDLLLHLIAVGDHSVKFEDFSPIFLKHHLALEPWFQGAITTSVQHLPLWEMIMLERRKTCFYLLHKRPGAEAKDLIILL